MCDEQNEHYILTQVECGPDANLIIHSNQPGNTYSFEPTRYTKAGALFIYTMGDSITISKTNEPGTVKTYASTDCTGEPV